MALIPGVLAFGSIPLSAPFQLNYGGEVFSFLFQSFDLGIGIVFVLGISSLGAYSLLFAGWGSGNKYSLMGALRASAQMISYELALGLSLVGILLIFGSFSFSDIIKAQQGPLSFILMGQSVVIPYLPNWGFFISLWVLFFFLPPLLPKPTGLPLIYRKQRPSLWPVTTLNTVVLRCLCFTWVNTAI